MSGMILVMGGVGYIGSYMVQQLQVCGELVVVFDNFVIGFWQLVQGVQLVEGDVGDVCLVMVLLQEYGICIVIYFVVYIIVFELVVDLFKYYGNNICQMCSLFGVCVVVGV